MIKRIAWNRGMKLSKEWRDKISQSKKGTTAWNKGLTKETDERVKKNAESKMGVKRPDMVGENNRNWNGYTYTYFDRRFHRQARKVLERHYKLMWDKMNLPNDPVIHHINQDFKDNSFDNLCVINRGEHALLHHELRREN